MKTSKSLKNKVAELTAIGMMAGMMSLSTAYAQDRGGNGGKGFIGQFEFNVEQIQGWLERGNLSKVDLSSIVPAVDSKKLASDVISASKQVLDHSIKLEFVDSELKVGEEVRTCLNFQAAKLIQCNNTRWKDSETPESRYMLTMHELMGIAGYENNDGLASEYKISRKILPYVAPATTYVLVDTPEVDDKDKWEQMIRCEGMVQDRTSPWSLKRRKQVVINAFNNGETYITSIVRDVGSWQEQITGGTRGNWKTTHTGIAAFTHFFTDGFAKAKVVKQSEKNFSGLNFEHPAVGPSSDGMRLFRVQLFGKDRYIRMDKKDSPVAVVYGPHDWMGTRIPLASLSCTYNHYVKVKLAKFKEYIETLPARGWVTMTSDEHYKDIHVSEANVLSPRDTEIEW